MTKIRGTKERTLAFLKSHPDHKYTAREIAAKLLSDDPAWENYRLHNSQQDLNKTSLAQQIAAEISTKAWKNRVTHHSEVDGLMEDTGRPRRIWWSSNPEEENVSPPSLAQHTPKSGGEAFLEKHMYPVLESYLVSQGITAMRIDETKSRNKRGARGNHWVFPDLVGFENLAMDNSRDTREIMKDLGANIMRILSFEVKINLKRSDVREAYFQAVSNSTWANFGYLVISGEQPNDVIEELSSLNSMHGIGIIRLNMEAPDESEIVIPASERKAIGWEMWGRLEYENKDFREFVEKIRGTLKLKFS